MLYKKTLDTYIWWMKQMIEKIEKYSGDIPDYETFINDEKTIDAVITPLTQIWEIASQMSKLYPDKLSIPYSEIIGMRNILVHMYHKVDTRTIWNIITKEIPRLKVLLEKHNLN